MTNFRHFQTEKSLQMTTSNLIKMAESSPNGWKKLSERRNCSLGAISPFLTVFSKDLYCRHVKTKACLEWVKTSNARWVNRILKLDYGCIL